MTPSVMLYSVLVAALIGAAALMTERIAAELDRPRRFVWLAALILSFLLPSYALLNGSNAGPPPIGADSPTAIEAASPGLPGLAPTFSGSAIEIDAPLLAWPDWGAFGAVFTVGWIASSAAIFGFHVLLWLSLLRKVRRAETRRAEGLEVRILDEYGPAVFGFWRPEIILPRWLFDANAGLLKIVLSHEREHVVARDQLTLLAALVLVAVAPWNLPLWWQLRRLRLAVEIDCDARVLESPTPETAYAEALLEVQQRRTRSLIAAVALIEPVSQLERRIRIMTSSRSPYKRTVIGVCALAAAAFAIAACAVNAPDVDAPIKPLPGPAFGPNAPAGPMATIGGITLQRYGTELRSDDPRVAVVELFFDESGALLRSTIRRTDEDIEQSMRDSLGGQTGFLTLCLNVLEGTGLCEIDAATNLLKGVIRIKLYGSPSEASDGRDSEDIDRRLAERYFAHIFSAEPLENTGYWVLLDSAGKPLAAGQEVLRPPFSGTNAPGTPIAAALEQRYPQVEIQRMSLTPIKDRQSRAVTDRSGKNVTLWTGWLAAESPLPTAAR